MESGVVSKSSRWLFSNKNLFKLSFPCLTRSTPKSLPAMEIGTTTTPPLIRHSNVHSAKVDDDKLKDVFDHLDVDRDGKISSKELMDYFASVGESVNHKVAKSVINEFDSDGDELLDFGDFVRLMKQEDNGELEDILRSAFEMFEVEKGCGCITPKGLQQMLRQLGDVKSHDECAVMIRAFDLDGNGFLDFHEFQLMMSSAN
ncbi:probable calcium-binding protein CML41 [Gastrolobium bilobum]|uniref:probable calcium-binding protein CML41 n=1 Tax=Gastrolobium bilobum TaxID=150636 RepID=UPI002AB201D0|nr:probable calcium-binding protein CML41 [Gastrolobium bilobum]